MKNYVRTTNIRTNEDDYLFNLDTRTGRIAFAFFVIGIVATVKTVKNFFKKGEEIVNEETRIDE